MTEQQPDLAVKIAFRQAANTMSEPRYAEAPADRTASPHLAVVVDAPRSVSHRSGLDADEMDSLHFMSITHIGTGKRVGPLWTSRRHDLRSIIALADRIAALADWSADQPTPRPPVTDAINQYLRERGLPAHYSNQNLP